MADTRGDEQDDENMRIILAAVKDVKHVHAIVFVINGMLVWRLLCLVLAHLL
jgi:uncharacterized protein involved in tellurium resistance